MAMSEAQFASPLESTLPVDVPAGATGISNSTGYQSFEAGSFKGSVAKIVKLEHAWRRLDGRNDDGFQVAPFPG